MVKMCESCGMPMRKHEEFGGGNTDNKYCVHCTDDQGSLKPFDVAFEGMKMFAKQTMGVSEEEAEKNAREMMAKMPAWADRFK